MQGDTNKLKNKFLKEHLHFYELAGRGWVGLK